MKIWNWFIGLFKSLWRSLFGTEKVGSIRFDSEPEIIVPKQLGAGMPDHSQQELKALAEDISNREAVLDAELVKAQIQKLSEETKIKQFEAQAQIENQKRLAALEEKRLELEAEEMRTTQSRLDLEKQAEIEREQFKTEQEQFRQSNEQVFAHAKQKQEQKEKARAERAAQKDKVRMQSARAKAKKRRVSRKVWRVRRAKIWNFLKENTGRLRSVVFSKKFGILLAVACFVAFAIWLYQAGYFSVWWEQVLVWLTQAWTWFAGLWQYRWYGLGLLLAGLLVWFGFSSRFATARQSLKDAGVNSFASLNTFARNLSIATGVLFGVGLSLVAMFGAYVGAPWIILGALGLIPIVAFSWRIGPGFWFRFLVSLVMEMFALAAFLPPAY